jgi:hypothetical protein
MYKVLYFLNEQDLKKGNIKSKTYKAISFADCLNKFRADTRMRDKNIYMVSKMID